MASIKNLKSKNRAVLTTYIANARELRTVGLDADYSLRKQQLADTPPAKLVRPLRALRAEYAQALQQWSRSVDGGANVDFPHALENAYLAAKRAARAGNGALVRLLAA